MEDEEVNHADFKSLGNVVHLAAAYVCAGGLKVSLQQSRQCVAIVPGPGGGRRSEGQNLGCVVSSSLRLTWASRHPVFRKNFKI